MQWGLAGEATRIIEELNACIENPNEFVLKKIQKDAERLRRTHPTDAYTILGALAALRMDVSAVHANHKQAIQITGDATAYENYASSLRNVRDEEGAYEQMQIAHSLQRTNLAYLYKLVDLSLLTGRFHEAAGYVRILENSNQSLPPQYDYIKDALTKICALPDITDDSTRSAFRVAKEIAVRKGCAFSGMEIHFTPNLFLILRVNTDADCAGELNEQFSEALCDSPNADLLCAPFVLSFGAN